MVASEQDKTVAERLVEIANATGNAVLALNADIGPDSFTKVVSALGNIGTQKALSLILNSDGGYIDDAFRIAKAIRASCTELEVIVPARAKSAATLIALSADRILFGKFGELGPLDPQVPDPASDAIRRSPLEIVKGLEFLRNYYVGTFEVMVRSVARLRRSRRDMTLSLDSVADLLSPIADPLYRLVNYRELGEAARDLAIGEEYAKETMRRWSPLNEDQANTAVDILVWAYPDHDYIIDIDEARDIGLSNVDPLDIELERLCYGVISSGESFVCYALPDGYEQAENGNDAAPVPGGNHGSTTGASCD